MQKPGIGQAAAIFAVVLAGFGKSVDDPLRTRLIGPVAGVCAFIGYAVFARSYRLTDEGRPITTDNPRQAA